MKQPILQQYLNILLNKYNEHELRYKVIKLIDDLIYVSVFSNIDGDTDSMKEIELMNAKISWKYMSLNEAINTYCPTIKYMDIDVNIELEKEIEKYYFY
jgi:hypothetical protein